MPFNVLLLPLLGGYIFITHFNLTRFHVRRYAGHHLLFHAAIAGSVLLGVSYSMSQYVAVHHPPLLKWWQAQVPFDYAGTGALGFLLGATLWLPANWIPGWRREEAAIRAIRKWGDFLEILLNYVLDNFPLQAAITTKSRKVYIGFVTSNFDPSYDRQYVRLMPTLSGHQRSDDLRYSITTDYTRVYQSLYGEDASIEEQADYFQVVIPVSEITSAKVYDPDVYELFRQQGADQPEEQASATPGDEGAADGP